MKNLKRMVLAASAVVVFGLVTVMPFNNAEAQCLADKNATTGHCAYDRDADNYYCESGQASGQIECDYDDAITM